MTDRRPSQPTWRLIQVGTDHCPSKCYIFDNGATSGPHLFHIPAADFWGRK